MIKEELLINTGLALGAIALAPSFAFESEKRAVGIQLWTLRDTLPKDVKGVLAQVGKAGFSEVETLDIHWIRVFLVHPYVILNQYLMIMDLKLRAIILILIR
jgi:hypothetical protein